MSVTIVVLGRDHPDLDDEVRELAAEEADRQGVTLPPYQGLAITPDGAQVHIFASPADAERARAHWAGS
jgi:hypothetical protein